MVSHPDSSPAAAQAAAPTDLGHSPDALAQRKAELLALLAQTAPELISDNQLNLDKLKDLLEPDRIADPLEHYELSWAGKTAARREIQKTSSHTLRPDPGNPAQAQHMLIEGENLEVLRVLQKSYYGKVKMIYIDPPYNTGSDSFVYPDNYSETLDEYQRRTGEKNEAGFLNKQNLWKKNSKESGQYHSAWLSMMYPRLYLARNLLRDDGVIFISIDDNEAANLKLLCDEVFGIENFVTLFYWQSKSGGGHDEKAVVKENEYILTYSKNKILTDFGRRSIDNPIYKLSDEFVGTRGMYGLNKLDRMMRAEHYSEALNYPIRAPDGSSIWPGGANDKTTDWNWRWSKTKADWGFNEKFLVVKRGLNNRWAVYSKQYQYFDHNGEPVERDYPFRSLITSSEFNTTSGGTEIKRTLGANVFDYAKPTGLVNHLSRISNLRSNEIILDFFAGSGTTTAAVAELNLEDNGNRQSISVQMPEVLDEDSEAYKAGYRTIADITRARIDKVIAKLKAEHPDKTADLACAHFTLGPSNFKVWRGNAGNAAALRDQLALFQRAEKMDSSLRGNEGVGANGQAEAQTAMLAELLLKHGLGALGVHAISKPKQLAGATVHRVRMPNSKEMWLCFDPYTEALKADIVKAAPAQVVMLNSCFVGSKADELLANLQLELSGLDIGLTVI